MFSGTTSTARSLESERQPALEGWRVVGLWDQQGRVDDRTWVIEDSLDAGRSADIAIFDRATSRRHARFSLTRLSDRVLVQDLDSHNGTWVNGHRVDRALARVGDVVRVGETLLAVDHVSAPADALSEKLGLRSAAMRALTGPLVQLAASDARVLLRGEPGVGKQVLAEALHELSGVDGELVCVNCARLSRDLIDSELFGHVRGAFTGAERDRDGLLVQADGGTLLLDEVGELPLDAQAHLLTVLEDGLVRPVGSDRRRPVEFRLISATNAPLEDLVSQGRFRPDLRDRISEWALMVPPLRERTADIPAIFRGLVGRELRSRKLREALVCNAWPDNVRGLVYAARRAELALLAPDPRALLLAPGSRERAPPWVPPTSPPGDAEGLERLLAVFEGNIAAIGRHTGCHRQVVYRWFDKFEVSR